MSARGYGWAIMALGIMLAASVARAGEADAPRAETRVEIRVEKPGADPQARIWINGKEVKPGEAIPAGAVGEIQVETYMDAGDEGGESASSRSQARIEVRTEREGEEPRVRIWVNGKEVEPGKAIDLGGKGRVRVQASALSGRRDRERSDERSGRGRAGRAVLGVMLSPLNDEAAERAKVDAGALVAGTLPDSPAEEAGLREGDVITAVDGKRVESPRQLAEYIGDRRPGDRVRLQWSRHGRHMEKTLSLGRHEGDWPPGPPERSDERPREAKRPERRKDEPRGEKERHGQAFLGVMATPLTEDIVEISGARQGVLISSLTDDSPADRAGLKPGDVITHVDDKEMNGPGELVEAIRDHKPGDRVDVVYYRMGKRREATVTLGERPGDGPGSKERIPLFDLPKDLFGEVPQLREYLEKLQPDIREWAERWRERQGEPVPAPELLKPRPQREPRDAGKDMGRILERLERIERRLDEIEKRIERRER